MKKLTFAGSLVVLGLMTSCGKTLFSGESVDGKDKKPGNVGSKTAGESNENNVTPPAACALAIASSPLKSYDVIDSSLEFEHPVQAIVRDFTDKGEKKHPDFFAYFRKDNQDLATTGLVEDRLVDGVPVFKSGVVANTDNVMITSKESFATWYKTSQYSYSTPEFKINLPMKKAANSYLFTLEKFKDKPFYPIDGKGFGNQNIDTDGDSDHNFSFTTQVHLQFTYRGDETFKFNGDDDLWVFIDGRLALDIGGVHHPVEKSIELKSLPHNLVPGKRYSLDIFHAERWPGYSRFYFETTIDLTESVPYTYTVETTGAKGKVSYSLVGGPAGMSIDPASGVITWMPGDTRKLAAKNDITIAASDESGCKATQKFNLDVHVVAPKAK